MRVEEANRIVVRPYITEKTFDLIERENKLVFLVAEAARKPQIRQALETLYDVEVVTVNTVRTRVGKKAYVRLTGANAAADLASKLGLV